MTKYHNRKIKWDGKDFASKKECARYIILKDRQEDGLIKDLQCQIKYVLIPSQREPDRLGDNGKMVKGKVLERECSYIADFQYIDNATGQLVVEDVKGYKKGGAYAVFSIKRKLMLQLYGIRVQEV